MPDGNELGTSESGISTSDVEALTGISRFRLTAYIKNGVVAPPRASAAPQSEMRWSADQIWLASKVPALHEGGLSLKQAAALADQGNAEIEDRLHLRYVQKIRETRRGLKDVLYRQSETADARRVGRRSDAYLRYIPQRFLALGPFLPGQPRTGAERDARLAEVLNTAVTLGWCTTGTLGSLSSVSADGASGTSYAFAALASPAMPSFSAEHTLDGGCYFAVAGKAAAPGCDGTQCERCTRFGRRPTQADLFEWKGRRDSSPELWDRTVMVDDLAEPYPTGIWSVYTNRRINGTAKDAEDSTADIPFGNDRTRRTVRPRLMPHEFPLPLGVTACVIPAGVFLCQQCDGGEDERVRERMIGQASAMRHKPFTLEDELCASRAAKDEFIYQESDLGPVMDPFAVPHTTADPHLKGWWHELPQGGMQRLVVPTRMALAPEDGYCVLCSSVPTTDRNDPTRYEMQLLVDASETGLLPE